MEKTEREMKVRNLSSAQEILEGQNIPIQEPKSNGQAEWKHGRLRSLTLDNLHLLGDEEFKDTVYWAEALPE